MAEGGGPLDPFNEDDPAAAEREARRRAREQRRAQRPRGQGQGRGDSGAGARRSLGERVSGALGGLGSSEPPSADPAGHEATDQPSPEPPSAPVEPADQPAEGTEQAPEPAADSREFFAMPRDSPEGGGHGGGTDGLRGEIMRRRLFAGIAVIAVIVVIVVIAQAAGGGDSEPADPVAAEPAVKTISLTIPEGLTLTQIDGLAKEAKLEGSYEKAAQKPPKGFPLARYGAEDAPSLEGFLFPATYELEKRARSRSLVDKQLEAFEQNIAEVDLKQAEKKNLTTYDIVKIASMIEREVSVAEERRLVAAVIYNRLADGEPLGIDATLRYELDDFDSPLLESELDADTPYNTRLNAGLPPTPIGNPGLASLEAAANPADKDFRFYVIKPGTCNEHVFTADQAEFDAAVAEYQAALEAEGGSPTDCG